MEQCSHQILKSGFTFSAFTIWHDPDGFRDIGRRLLEPENNRTGVVRPVFAFVDGAGQDEHRGRRGLCALPALAVIDSKWNRRLALPAMYGEVPSLGRPGPLNIHGISLKVGRSLSRRRRPLPAFRNDRCNFPMQG
jgi:hypothetical protein